jgi:hypothetical protein
MTSIIASIKDVTHKVYQKTLEPTDKMLTKKYTIPNIGKYLVPVFKTCEETISLSKRNNKTFN